VTTRSTRTSLARYVTAQWWASPAWTLVDFLKFERRAHERSIVLVRVFYAASLVWALQQVGSWPQHADREIVNPLWPAAWWFDWVSVRTGVNIIIAAYLGSSLLAMLFPERRLARAAYAFTLLQHMALVNSFFKINHSMHAWFFMSAVLVLLPDGRWRSRHRISDRHDFLSVVWCSQLVILLFYTLTGVWKVAMAVSQFVAGEVSAFHFHGFSLILADRLLASDAESVIGDVLVRQEMLGWALFLGTMYLESASIVVAFRPRLHRIWGVGLILFHIGTHLAMRISFPPNVLLLGLFLVNSPFLPDRFELKATVLDLPVVRFCARTLVPLVERTSLRQPVPRLDEGTT
jgi:hypothetical protein